MPLGDFILEPVSTFRQFFCTAKLLEIEEIDPRREIHDDLEQTLSEVSRNFSANLPFPRSTLTTGDLSRRVLA